MSRRREYPSRLFRREEINGDCPDRPYLTRWLLWRSRSGRALYLHRFTGSDWTRDLHDHPKVFVSIGLRGGYVEERPAFPRYWPRVGILERARYRAPWVRWFRASHVHRLRVTPRGCWTLVFVGRTRRAWGFWPGRQWTHWRRYVGRFGGCS